jgi:gluconokinase
MGVAGCGKSTLGRAVAERLGVPLIEGDDFHAPDSRRKMSAGIALTDADRAEWLQRLGDEFARHPQGAVLTCSALRRAYRDQLRAAVPGLRFVFADITRDEAEARVRQRAGTHLFPVSLVDSQFATLERPRPHTEPDVLRVDATEPVPALAARAEQWLRSGRGKTQR